MTNRRLEEALRHLWEVEPRFAVDNILNFRLVLPAAKYESLDDAAAFHARL